MVSFLKKLIIPALLLFFCTQLTAQSISKRGYPEHFVAGGIIAGTTSYFVYKKTNNKFKAWIIGAVTASAIGYLKEVIDPLWFNRVRNNTDFGYTVLGGAVGASIVIPLRPRKPKKRPNIAAAFK